MNIRKSRSAFLKPILFLLFLAPLQAGNCFEHLTVENGLAHTDVTCLEQDSSGLIWIGTNAGLQNYDGYNLHTLDYYRNSSSKIRKFHNRITALEKDGNNLWVGTKSGLLCLDLSEHKYKPISLQGSRKVLVKDIRSICVDESHYLWIRTENQIYVSRFNEKSGSLNILDSIGAQLPVKDPQLVISMQSCNHAVFLTTATTVLQIGMKRGKIIKEKYYDTSSILPKGSIINNLVAMPGFLYIRTEKGCMRFSYNKKKNELDLSSMRSIVFSDYMEGLPQSTIGKMVIDKDETIWCIYQDGLLELHSPFGASPYGRVYKKEYNDPNSLSTNFLSVLYIDMNNNLWVGTWGGGINFMSLKEPLFSLIKYKPGSKFTILDEFVKATERDKDGTLWILTQKGGLSHYDEKNGLIKNFKFPDIPMTNRLFKDLLISSDNKYIFIGMIQGLLVFDKRTEKATVLIGRGEQSILKNHVHIYSLDADKYGNIWIGTWDAGLICLKYSPSGSRILYRLSKDRSSRYHLTSNLVSHIYCDKKKDEVMVCTDFGLNRIVMKGESEIEKILTYQTDVRNEKSLSSDFLSVIDKQNDSTYWVGTLGGGLNKLILKSSRSNAYSAMAYTTKEGLSSNEVEIVLVDNQGKVWFGGNGITKLDPVNNLLTHYDYRDGLQGNSFKIGAGYKDNTGKLFFGGIYGLNYFDPKTINPVPGHLKLIFTDLYIHNHLIEVGAKENGRIVLNSILNDVKKLKLRYNQNDFTLAFSALNFWSPNRVCYRYRLKGYNKDWQHITGNQNKVFYSNLHYGDYIFEIQVSSDAGNTWGKYTRSLEIKIIPPWWLSIWAKIFYSILIILIVFALLHFYSRELIMAHKLEIREIEEKQLEENHQLKLQFFMNISHEFKTPLTLILFAIERLTGRDISVSPEGKNLLDIISRNAYKMLSLITELMDFRKTDIGKDTLRLTKDNVNVFIDQISDEFRPWAKKKNIELNVNCQETVEMYFDKEKLAKIVYNLFSNAIKYTNEDGKVELFLRKGRSSEAESLYPEKYIETFDEKDQDCCIITVRDTGIGITKESISHIFDRFFQVVGSTSMHLGSGIGLAVAKNMVLSHKGRIIVSSERNVGTEFIVCIPLEIETENVKSEIQPESESFDIHRYLKDQHLEYNYEKKDIVVVESTESEDIIEEKPVLLIVEDNQELLYNLKQYFSTKYAVLTAENGRVGYELCKQNYPDLIISDVMMPEMDGIQLCVSIRENLNIAYIPIILLTAKSEIEHQMEGYEAGADLYVPKPFSLKFLELNVSRLIAHKNQLCQTENAIASNLHFKDAMGTTVREAIKDFKEKDFINKLNDLIIGNLDNPSFSVEKICKELGVGRTKLYTKVKDLSGQPLGDLIRDIRLNKAAYLLQNTDNNITEIIYEVGFGSNSHFSKAFKVKFGMTPSEYAKKA